MRENKCWQPVPQYTLLYILPIAFYKVSEVNSKSLPWTQEASLSHKKKKKFPVKSVFQNCYFYFQTTLTEKEWFS